MRSIFITATAMAVAVGSAQAQRPRESSITVTRGDFAVMPYAGYLVSSSLFDGPINSSLTVQSSPLYGVQASMPLSPSASLLGGIAYSSGDLKAGIPIIGGISFGNMATTVFDASVELRSESFSKSFMPVVQLGGGAIYRKVSIAGLHASSTDFMVSGGIGADVPLSSNLAMRFMAKDYWAGADFGSIGPITAKNDDVHAIGLSGGLRITF